MGEYRTARARLKRAVVHAETLSDRWNAIRKEDLFTLRAMVNPAGQGRVRLTANKPIPEEFSLLFGEMLYQLRSALDACIYQASIYATTHDPPPNQDQAEFPVCDDRKDFPKQAKRRLALLPPAIQNAIERIQPYNTPSLSPELLVKDLNRSLGILHDLARKDRHRKLHVIGQVPLSFKPEIIVPPGVTITKFKVRKDGPLGKDQDLVIFQLAGFRSGMIVSMSPNLLVNLGLDEPPPPCHPSDTFPERLQGMLDVVNSVIIAFEHNL
jgi:hypothetical protein